MKFLTALLSFWITTVTLAVNTANAAEPGIEHRVEDLEYGHALFQYFQQDDLAAITQLLVAEQRPRSNKQIEESALLLADLFYSYGLYAESNLLFSKLLSEETSQGIKNRVWFNLAKLNYEQGRYDEARDLLSNITKALPPRIEDERQYLLTNLYLANRQYKQAAKASRRIANHIIWRSYSDYNIGVSLVEDEQFDQGKPLLDNIGQKETASSEMKALRDKANLALGFSQLKRSRPESAIEYLSRIRIQGPLSHDALLGAGWAWSRLGDDDKALTPWLKLTQKNTIDSATQEALLAIPALFEKNKDIRLAVHYFELAANQFDQQLTTLDQVTQSINQGELIIALQVHNLVQPGSVLANHPPQSVATPYLHLLMASQSFQNEIKRYRELRDIQSTLEHWEFNLPALSLMLKERRRNFEQKLPLLEQSSGLETLEALSEKRATYAATLDSVQLNQDYLPLATSDEKAQLARLDSIANGLKKLSGKKNTDSQADMHRMLSGILHWNISTDYAPRLWKAKKQLLALDKALTESNQRAQSLQHIAQSTRLGFTEFENRIDGQEQKIESFKNRVVRLITQQEARINKIAINAIEQQQRHIIQLRLNARYSLARLYDSLVTEQ